MALSCPKMFGEMWINWRPFIFILSWWSAIGQLTVRSVINYENAWSYSFGVSMILITSLNPSAEIAINTKNVPIPHCISPEMKCSNFQNVLITFISSNGNRTLPSLVQVPVYISRYVFLPTDKSTVNLRPWCDPTSAIFQKTHVNKKIIFYFVLFSCLNLEKLFLL